MLGAAEIVLRLLSIVDVAAGVPTTEQGAWFEANMLTAVADAELAFRNRPSCAMEAGGISYRHDALGRRCTDPAADESLPGVVFLGDSTTYGWGVTAAESLPGQVAAALDGRIRPLNLGVCGYGTAQERALYLSQREDFGDAPVVVLVFYPNDLAREHFQWDERTRTLYVDALPLPYGVQRVLWRSELYRALVSWHTARLSAAGELGSDPAYLPRVLAQIGLLADEVRADGRTLLVASLPGMLELDPYPFEELNALLREECERIDVPFVDLLPGFLVEPDHPVRSPMG